MVLRQQNRYGNISLNDLTLNSNNKNLIEYFKDRKNNIETMIRDCENVIITGNVGVGKSYIVNAFLNDLKEVLVEEERNTYNWDSSKNQWIFKIIKRNINTKYIAIYELVKELRKEYNNEEVNKDYFNCDILVIDEAGVQFGTDAERQTLFELFEYRYNNFKPTILISNLSIDGDENTKALKNILGARIIDRLTAGNSKQFRLLRESLRHINNN